MCEICHFFHCPSSCPGMADKKIGQCGVCHTAIYASEPHLCMGETPAYHTECLESMRLTELLAHFGIELSEA